MQFTLPTGAHLEDEGWPTPFLEGELAVDRQLPCRQGHRRGWIVRRALLIADLTGLGLAFLLVQVLFAQGGAVDHVSPIVEASLFLLTLPMWILVARLFGLYERDRERAEHSTVDDVAGIFQVVTIGTWLLLLGTWLTGLADPDPLRLTAFWAFAVILLPTARAIARALYHRSPTYVQKTVIVGSGKIGQLVARKLLGHPEFGVHLVGFVDDPWERSEDIERPPLLGSLGELPSILRANEVERIVIAFPTISDDRILHLIRLLRYHPVQVDVVPRFFDILSPNVDLHSIEGLPLIGLRPFRLSRSAQLVKRVADIFVATLTLVLLAPLFSLIAVLIKLDSRGPIFFRQVRMGTGDRTFRIYKFRTMVRDAEELKDQLAHLNKHGREGGDARMFKIPDDPRVTRVGRFLRRYCIDEVPQLVNVVRGEMSLVGPRPLVLDEDQHVRHWARRRLIFLPGITGPWQALGRSDIPFEEMISLDYLYVTEWSLFNDLKWIARTIPALFRLRDAY